MDDVFKVYENHHLFRGCRPEWFDCTPEKYAIFKELAKTGVAYFLPKRAVDGSIVYVVNLERFDIEKYKSESAFNFLYNTTLAYMEDENNQILGWTFVLNYYNCPLKTLTSFSIRDCAEFAASANKCAGRYKRYYLVGLPSAAHTLLAAAKKVMTEKQRDRLVMIKDHEELSQHIDKSILTTHLGGSEDENEVIEIFMKTVDERIEKVRETYKVEIDMKKAAACRDIEASIGSFRTLEID